MGSGVQTGPLPPPGRHSDRKASQQSSPRQGGVWPPGDLQDGVAAPVKGLPPAPWPGLPDPWES